MGTADFPFGSFAAVSRGKSLARRCLSFFRVSEMACFPPPPFSPPSLTIFFFFFPSTYATFSFFDQVFLWLFSERVFSPPFLFVRTRRMPWTRWFLFSILLCFSDMQTSPLSPPPTALLFFFSTKSADPSFPLPMTQTSPFCSCPFLDDDGRSLLGSFFPGRG